MSETEDFLKNARALATLIGNLQGMGYRCRNDREWTMEFVSEQCRTLTGYTPTDLVDNRTVSYNQLIHPKDQERVLQTVQQALQEKGQFQITYQIYTKSGQTKWVWEQGSAVKSPSGEVEALEGYIFDVNDRMQDEEVIRQYQDLVNHIQYAMPIPVRADAGQIEQVLMNLAVNARDAMPDGGTLTIETTVVDLDPIYASTHFDVQPGSYVMMAVSDTGIGMDTETRRRIFEPFFTTKEKGQGTGLGLSTVYGIVRQHGGYVWVYSEPGQGSTFKIYLPATDEPAVSRKEPSSLQRMPEGSETILLVEDEVAVRNLVKRVLQGLGYRVLAASQPTEAEGLFEQEKGEIDLLLTDLVLPDRNGLEVLQEIRRIDADAKVIMITTAEEELFGERALKLGAAAFIEKPLDLAQLGEMLERRQ